jgi:hypothetical protein
MKTISTLAALLIFAYAPSITTPALADEAPQLSNIRFEGLTVRDGIYISRQEYGREYKIDVVTGGAPIKKVLLKTTFNNGRTSPLLEREFTIIPNEKGSTIVVPSKILDSPVARNTEWWVVDERGRESNRIVQRVVIE